MTEETMPCPECKGKGKISAIGCPGFKPIELGCDMCKGAKTVSKKVLEWRERGRAIRDERIARGKTLRVEARERGLDVVLLSEMERGIVEPVPREGK